MAYKTGWMKKIIDGVSTKVFAFAHAKTVYTDYENKKTLSDKLSEIDTEIGNKANKTEIMDKIDGKIEAILDPDNEVVEGSTVTTYDPGFVVGKTLSYTTGEVEDNAQYIAALNYTKIADGATYRMTTSASSTFRLIVYDSNKKIVKAWNDGTDGAWRDNGGEFELPTGMDIKYIRCYSETTTIPTAFDIVNVSTNASIFKIVSGGATRFSKLAFKNQYALKPYDIDNDPNMHGLKILRDNDCNEEFSIVEISAPSKAPHESTLTLMNSGEKTVQFVDFSSMRYDESTQGTIELVCQSRGANTPLPEFRINFNNGDGNGRVQKFVVRPDALPIKMTSKGLLVRKNNAYTNESTDDDWYEFNFKDVLNNIEAKADKSETTVNLLNPTLKTTTQNGVTCTNNGDGTYTIDTGGSPATADCYFILCTNFNLESGKSYRMIGNPGKPNGGSSGSDYRLEFYNGSEYFGEYGGGTTVTGGTPNKIQILITEGVTVSNLIFKPMLTTNLNATYDDFVPFTGTTGKLNGDVADIQSALDNKADSSHTHTKSQITDFPTSLPASDVYAWAKASTKPTYTYSEVGAAEKYHVHTWASVSKSITSSDTYSTWSLSIGSIPFSSDSNNDLYIELQYADASNSGDVKYRLIGIYIPHFTKPSNSYYHYRYAIGQSASGFLYLPIKISNSAITFYTFPTVDGTSIFSKVDSSGTGYTAKLTAYYKIKGFS